MTEVSPFTSKVLLKVEAPETPKFPPIVLFEDVSIVVKKPVDEELAPITVPSIAPPFISTVDNVDVPFEVKSPLIIVVSLLVPRTIWFEAVVSAELPKAIESE